MNIFLIGFMGTGKSTISAALGRRLSREVVEMDELIVKREGMPISEMRSGPVRIASGRLLPWIISRLSKSTVRRWKTSAAVQYAPFSSRSMTTAMLALYSGITPSTSGTISIYSMRTAPDN